MRCTTVYSRRSKRSRTSLVTVVLVLVCSCSTTELSRRLVCLLKFGERLHTVVVVRLLLILPSWSGWYEHWHHLNYVFDWKNVLIMLCLYVLCLFVTQQFSPNCKLYKTLIYKRLKRNVCWWVYWTQVGVFEPQLKTKPTTTTRTPKQENSNKKCRVLGSVGRLIDTSLLDQLTSAPPLFVPLVVFNSFVELTQIASTLSRAFFAFFPPSPVLLSSLFF